MSVVVSLMHFVSIWQFVSHDSDFEKTKLKLLEAANLVDKVRLCQTVEWKKQTCSLPALDLIFPSAPAVLQTS